MKRIDFYLKACISFATNSKVIWENLTADQNVSNIHYLSEALTSIQNTNFEQRKKRSKKKKVLAYIRGLRPHCQAAAATMSANGLQADTMSL